MLKEKCLLCGSNSTKSAFIYKGKDVYLEKINVVGFDLKWFQCLSCEVYFSKQYKGIEKVYADDNLYDAQYDAMAIKLRFRNIMRLNSAQSDNAFRCLRVKQFHQKYLSEFYCKKRIYDVLDIGAGLGVFLSRFIEDNYRGTALEINRVASEHIRKELKIPVYTGMLQNFKNKYDFDLITMNKVVEHIKNPFIVLAAAKKRLNKKGIIYLELPDSIAYEFNGNISDSFASGHYMVYNPRSIFFLLNKSGFEILAVDRLLEPSGKRTIYAFARKSVVTCGL